MSDPTEDTINDLMASYFRSNGLKVTSQLTSRIYSGRKQPDFELLNGKILYGEGEWSKTYSRGLTQAIEYGDIIGASGYFLIAYPESLRKKVSSKRIKTSEPSELLSGIEYRGLIKLKDMPVSLFNGQLEEIVGWITETLEQRPKKNPEEYIRIMRDLVSSLSNYLPSTHPEHLQLFENVTSPNRENEELRNATRRATAYLLLNQIVFYHIIAKGGKVPEIDEKKLVTPEQLYVQYFKPVTDKINYHAIFDFDVASILPKKSNEFLAALVRSIKELAPEDFTRNLLGTIFHSLIPLEIRKPIAAFYTNPFAANLLASLSIQDFNEKVADYACGSGTLLVAAYDRKMELSKNASIESIHKKFIEQQISGLDIMPFAAHLAVVQLAIKNPIYLTDKVRIGVKNSTFTSPLTVIKSLHSSILDGQRKVFEFDIDAVKPKGKKEGSISGKGAGADFELGKVDVVMMNPPFSRKQHISSSKRAELYNRFLDYKKYISNEQNYNVYFVFLADRFLNKGRQAMVLPATMLKQDSSAGFRQLIRDRYCLEYVIVNEFRSAFSEDTSFRDMLFIARKEKNKDDEPAIFASLKILPNQENIQDILITLETFKKSNRKNIDTILLRGKKVPQKTIQETDNWYILLPGESQDIELDKLEKITNLKDAVDNIIQGFRYEEKSEFVSTKNTMISIQREKRVRSDIEVISKNSRNLKIKNPNTGQTLEIPVKKTFPAIRTASLEKNIEIKEPLDYIVMERFQNDRTFWNQKDVDLMLLKRRRHIESRKTKLFLAGYGNVDLSSDGTMFLCFCCPNPIAPTWAFWCLQTKNYDHSVLLALWLNSTFAISELLNRRTEVRGAYMHWGKTEIETFPVINPDSLSSREIQQAQSLLKKVNKLNFPPLIKQLEDSFSGRTLIDMFFRDLLKIKMNNNELIELQKETATRIKKMKEMMSRD